ncbi:ATP-binding response regulator [Shewanella youngdeokensis]|uniref:Response regulator n=1 Tax=Shewanella youngdeokensis TaxID=2999068 RepID=A0ABZ0K3W4_9GAMM|nr:response regulator [Shewanella sp. DAU334]
MKFKDNAVTVNIAFIIVLVLTVSQAIYTLNKFSSGYEAPISETQVTLIDTSKSITAQLEILKSTLELCTSSTNQCNSEQVLVQTKAISKNIDIFTSIASSEKQLVSLSGTLNFDFLNLYFNKFNEQKNYNELSDNIERSFSEVKDVSFIIANKVTSGVEASSELSMQVMLIIQFIVLVLFIAGWYLLRANITHSEKEKKRLSHSFHNILNDVKELNQSSLKARLSNVDSSSDEKKIYSMLLFSFEKLDKQMSKTDLYQRLYNLLGYEIRGITNTIQGGINLLVDVDNQQEVSQAKEVLTATRTLENLAENFNLLSTVETTSNSKIVEFYDLIDELVVLLSTKSKQQNKTIEYYIDNSIPLSFHGHHTGLFWMLLMQISDTLSSSDAKKVLFTLSCTNATKVEKLQLNIDLYVYDQDMLSIAQIENLDWGLRPKKDITNRSLVKALVSNIKNYHVIQKDIEDITRVRISFDVNPVDYQNANNQLQQKTLLICGAAGMGIDVIDQALVDSGATTQFARTANDVFHCLNGLSPQDGIIITSTMSGVNLSSLCKIVQARVKGKQIKLFLFLSAADKHSEDLSEFVDYVFHQPCPPSRLIPNIIDEFNNDKSVAEQEVTEKILIVEDDKLQQFILKKILTDLGFDCDTANDGKEAIESVKDYDYKTIFMDCIMPNVDGLEATSRIRQYDAANDLPARVIIGATALTSNDEHNKCINAGMDSVIRKPYKKDEIFSALRKYLAMNKVS